MFKLKICGNNFDMKKLILFGFFVVFWSMCFYNNLYFYDTLKSLNIGSYSVFGSGDFTLNNYTNLVRSQGVKIYTFEGDSNLEKSKVKEALCEQVVVVDFDINKYIKNNNLKLVKTECMDGIKVSYFLCKKLPKKTFCNQDVFNIVIAQRSDSTVIGYPAIMGSF